MCLHLTQHASIRPFFLPFLHCLSLSSPPSKFSFPLLYISLLFLLHLNHCASILPSSTFLLPLYHLLVSVTFITLPPSSQSIRLSSSLSFLLLDSFLTSYVTPSLKHFLHLSFPPTSPFSLTEFYALFSSYHSLCCHPNTSSSFHLPLSTHSFICCIKT